MPPLSIVSSLPSWGSEKFQFLVRRSATTLGSTCWRGILIWHIMPGDNMFIYHKCHKSEVDCRFIRISLETPKDKFLHEPRRLTAEKDGDCTHSQTSMCFALNCTEESYDSECVQYLFPNFNGSLDLKHIKTLTRMATASSKSPLMQFGKVGFMFPGPIWKQLR